MRITGLASGMDVDSIVKKLMAARRAPLDKLTQQQTLLSWQQEQYRDVSIKLVDFRNNKLSNYGLSASIAAKQVNVTGNTTAVTAVAGPGATAGTMTIEVTKLATSASLTSGTGAGTVDTSLSLSALKAAGTINYTADGSGNLSISINNASISLNENTDTLATMVSKINSSSGADVNAFLDASTGKMSLTAKTSGTGGSVAIAGDILSNFDLTTVVAGENADVTINGIATTRSSNTFTENGVEITLNALSGGSVSKLSVVTNTDKTVETIKAFIADYNSLLDTVNGKLNEERYRKYTPLTDDQKKEMSDDEITLWETKAKSGLLHNDSTLSQAVNNIRLSSITDVTIDGNKVNLTSLGISTGDYTSRGKLIIKDEAKLRAAIEANPDQVTKFFTQQSTETDPTLKKSPTNPDNGLFNRLSNNLMTALEGMNQKAGTSRVSTDANAAFNATSLIGTQLSDLTDRISAMNDRLTMAEDNYYKQFTAMETAINKYNSQSTSLFNSSS